MLLSPQDFFTQWGSVVVEILKDILSDLRSDGLVMAMKVFETCIRASPQQGTELIKPVLPKIFEYVSSSKQQNRVLCEDSLIDVFTGMFTPVRNIRWS